MHDEFPHWNSLEAQEEGAHSTSSEPSPQSSSLLHTKFREMQRPLAHVNSFGAQVIFPKELGKEVSSVRQLSVTLDILINIPAHL